MHLAMFSPGGRGKEGGQGVGIDQFRYIKIQPNTIDLGTILWGINPTNSAVIPQGLVFRLNIEIGLF